MSILGWLTGSDDAAAAQSNAANQSNQTQLQMFNTLQNETAPYRAAGTKALGDLQTQMPDLTRQFTQQDFQQNPGYQFQLQQGQQAIQNSALAKGGFSGATMKSLDNYSQGLANTDYQQALNNFTGSQQQRYNMLSGVAGMGVGANTQSAAAGTNAGNNISSNQIGVGNSNAAAASSSSLMNLGSQAALIYALA